MAAGRRSFKTERAKRKLIHGTEHWPGALTLANSNFFAGAPTYGQAKRIFWKDLKLMTLPFQRGKPSETELVIRLVNGSEIHVVGTDKPERMEGSPWHGGVLDEYGNMKPESWPEHVQPVTADTGAWVDFIGVPEGRNHYWELKQTTASLSGWEFFTWHSADVLPSHVIVAARAMLSEPQYRQEYEGSFELRTGLMYGMFTREGNVLNVPFDPRAPLHRLACDFNAGEKPMAWFLVQPGALGDFVTKEFVMKNTNTDEMCNHVIQFLEQTGYVGRLEIAGDHYGASRNAGASRSSYQIMRHRLARWLNTGGEEVVKHKVVRSIDDRVDALRARVKSADGTRHLFVSEACPALIKDFENASYDKAGKPDQSNPERTHPTDALSYDAYNYHPVHLGVSTTRTH